MFFILENKKKRKERKGKTRKVAIVERTIVTSSAVYGAHEGDETAGAITPGVNYGKCDIAVKRTAAVKIRQGGYDKRKEAEKMMLRYGGGTK